MIPIWNGNFNITKLGIATFVNAIPIAISIVPVINMLISPITLINSPKNIKIIAINTVCLSDDNCTILITYGDTSPKIINGIVVSNPATVFEIIKSALISPINGPTTVRGTRIIVAISVILIKNFH